MSAGGEKTGVMTVTLALISCATFTAIFGHQILISVVPLYADEIGGGYAGAGLTTGLFMFSAVLTQIQMPRILRRFGYRATLAAGTVLLGVPAFLYVFTGSLVSLLGVTVLRGVGFGIVVVVFVALVVETASPDRRGEALGVIGGFITVPTIFGSALGLWLVDNTGFNTTFILGAAIPLIGVISAALVEDVRVSDDGSGVGFFAGLRRAPLLRMVVIFSSVTLCAGVIFTFLPISAPGTGLFSATVALLFLGVSITFFRWWGGKFSDRRSPSVLLVPSLVLAALGMASLAAGGLWLLLGAALFGAGFGMLQNATLLMTMNRVSESEYGLGSTLWNVAFDGGTGAGALALGFVIALTGFFPAYLLCAALLLCAIPVVYADRRNTKET